MTFTYSSTDISTNLAKVRLEIFDTNSADPLLTDEEIAFAIADEPTLIAAAARCAEIISANFARDFNFEADGVSVRKGQRAKFYREMAAKLRTRSTGGITTAQTRHNDGWNANRGVDAADVTVTRLTSPIDWP